MVIHFFIGVQELGPKKTIFLLLIFKCSTFNQPISKHNIQNKGEEAVLIKWDETNENDVLLHQVFPPVAPYHSKVFLRGYF